MLEVHDAIDVGSAAKAEEPVLRKHNIDLGIGKWHVSGLLHDYMHRCLRRYYGIDRQGCAVRRNHIVRNVTEAHKATRIECPQREWTTRYHLSDGVETI